MCTRTECIARLSEVVPYIHQEFGVESLSIFGSVARGDNRSNSDVDIFVEMPPKIFQLSALKNYLESILNTSVDLIRRHSNMSQEFLNEIKKDAITIL